MSRLLVLSGLCVLYLSGCGGGAQDSEQTAPPRSSSSLAVVSQPSSSLVSSSVATSSSPSNNSSSNSSAQASSISSSDEPAPSSSSHSSRLSSTHSSSLSSSHSSSLASRSSVSSSANSSSQAAAESSAASEPQNLVPNIQALYLMTFDNNNQATPFSQVENGASLDLSQLPQDKFNFVAESADETQTGSVHFLLEGPISIDRWENNAIYTLATEPDHLSRTAEHLPSGNYSLTLTPYALPDMGGAAGTPVVIHFSVQASPIATEPPETQPPLTPSPSPTNPVWNGNTNSAGFTQISPSSDSRLIYVSSSLGDDANDCLSEQNPCKTLSAAKGKMRAGFPDHLYLKRGDTWRDENLTGIKPGRSIGEPAVVSFYGAQGARPRLENAGTAFLNTTAPNGRNLISNLHIIGLEFSAYRLVYGSPEFSGSASHKSGMQIFGSNENILIEDCVFTHTELALQDFSTTNTSKTNPVNIVLRRNIWTGAYVNSSSLNQNSRPSNLYAASVNGLRVEDNVFDHGGWHPQVMNASANMYNHNIYIQASTVGNSVVLRNNIITRASSHGVHGRPGGLYENNYFARNAVNLQMGYKNVYRDGVLVNDNALKAGTFARALNNVITEGNSMIKGTNPCSGVNLCTAALWGLITENPGEGDFTLTNNIVHSRSLVDNQWPSFYNSLSATSISSFGLENGTGNIMWKWRNQSEGTEQSYPDPGRTLANYSAHLGHAQSFDTFMNIVLTRPLQTWDEKYTANAINNYIRAGFGR